MEKHNKRNRKLNMFALLFTGFLLSCTAALVYIGNSLNFREFLNAGRVYDFSGKDLEKSSKSWQYSQEERGYHIQKQKALNKWKVNGTESSWEYLYLQIGELSVPEVETSLYYYNRDGSRIAEQAIRLTQGENIIILEYPELGMYRLGLRLYGVSGGFISIQSMQLREKANGFFPQRFFKIVSVCYLGFLAAYGIFFFLKRRLGWNYCWEAWAGGGLAILQYMYQIFSEGACRRVHGRTGKLQRKNRRRFLLCLFFLWMGAANIAGWLKTADSQRYYMLSVVVFLALIFAHMWEHPLQEINWNKPISLSWIMLWAGVLVSDCFVVSYKVSYGAVMLFACGCFIFVWNNQEKQETLLYEIMQALEIDFWIAVGYCVLFRTKKLAIRYNGIFLGSEEFSMYAVLMLAVFLTKLVRFFPGKVNLWKSVYNVAGAVISLYFVFRASNEGGFIAAGIVLFFFAIKQIRQRREWIGDLGKAIKHWAAAGVVGFLCVCAVHYATKYLPAFLGTEIEYEDEFLISNVSPEEMAAFEELQPGLMEGVVSAQDMEYGMYLKNYLRRIGLFGERGTIKVHRVPADAYSGYVKMAYQYGIFILVPYLILQICMVGKGISGMKKEGKAADIWLLMVAAIFICFCVFGNPENMFGHPLWFCYYVGMGYWFQENKGNIGNKGEKEKNLLEEKDFVV